MKYQKLVVPAIAVALFGGAALSLTAVQAFGGFGQNNEEMQNLQTELHDSVLNNGVSSEETQSIVQEIESLKDSFESERESEFNSSELSSYLGLNFDEYKTLRMSGVSLVEYADANGLDIEQIKSILVAEHIAHLDEALANGDIDQDQYDRMIDHIDDMIDHQVEGFGFGGMGQGGRGEKDHMMGGYGDGEGFRMGGM
ncbi:hypothetical protein KC669_03665 [Candidatus Dojkabacteria bacterium]|uniref:DUF2680 domain-containing protein n=1 Tax=Candidatus Dojkabacteria bacterium TaxID=2099670 RepID=A0A955LBG2_9BACT|nr:hypothetical protein [Candidatus Dojkabacteria bacterium]